MNTENYKENPETILVLSKRTVSKILRRAKLKCSLCGWNEAQCDVHHILPKKDNGSNEMKNLICVCPNCHRKLHELGDKYKTKEYLSTLSLHETFPEWRDYYNPKVSQSTLSGNYCKSCNAEIILGNTYCSTACAHEKRKKFDFDKNDVEQWKNNNLTLTAVGKKYSVSANAVKKRLKALKLFDYYKAKDIISNK